jgi:uncharacterized membrane protein YfhO
MSKGKNFQKQQQEKKQNKLQGLVSNQKQSGQIEQSIDFFEKYVGKKAILLVIFLIMGIGYLAFKDYLLINNTYWFKDIGSDEINGTYPGIVAATNLHNEAPESSWSFYFGMGQNVDQRAYITEPYTLFGYIVNYTGVSIWGINFHVLGRFLIYFFTALMVGGIMAYYYMRTLNFTHFASTIGALLYAFMGYSLIGSAWQHAADPLMGIFLLFAFEQLYRKGRWYFFPFAVAYLCWNPFYTYLFGIFLFVYSIFRFMDEEEWDTQKYGILLLKMIGLGILGMGMNAVNVLNAYVNMFNSPRVSGNVSYIKTLGNNPLFDLNNFPEWLTVIYRLFSNDLIGNGTQFKGWSNYLEAPVFYSGLISLLLLTQVFTFVDRRRKVLFISYILFWTSFVFIPFFRHALHLFVGNYYKGPFDVIISFTLIFMAAYSLSYIDRLNKINFWALIPTFLLFMILLNAKLVPVNFENPIDSGLKTMINLFLVSHLIILSTFHFKKYKIYTQAALIITVSLELAFLSGKTVNQRVTFTFEEMRDNPGGYKDKTIDAVAYLKQTDENFYRIEKDYASGKAQHSSLNDAQAQGFFSTPNYSSFNQPNYIRFLEEMNIIRKGIETDTRWAQGLRTRPLAQVIGNVKYYFSKEKPSFYLANGFADSIKTFGDVKLLRNRYFVPFGFGYDAFITHSDFRKLSTLQKDIMLMRAFVTDSTENVSELKKNYKQISLSDTIPNFSFQLFRSFTDSLKKDTLQITIFKHGDIWGKSNYSKKKMMFISTPYDAGWTATINGKPAKINRMNIGFWGIEVGPGNQTIEFHHKLEGKGILAYVSLFFNTIFYLMLLYTIWMYFKKKKEEKFRTIKTKE